MSLTVLDVPQVITRGNKETDRATPWHVILYNDEVHTVNEVILQVQKATGASVEVAFEITMAVHTEGKAICFSGPLSECERVAHILREIALTVQVTPASQ